MKTLQDFLVKLLGCLGLFGIGLGFVGFALLMETHFMWLIFAGFVILLVAAYFDWVEKNY
jgi:hypothetical protein